MKWTSKQPNAEPSDYAAILRNNGFRATPIRLAAIHFLASARGSYSIPQFIKELKHALKTRDADWATVYRLLLQFERAGLVSSFQVEGVSHYEWAGHEAHGHHHHLACTQCDKVEHLELCDESLILKAASKFRFSEVRHRLELFGICPDCQTRQKKSDNHPQRKKLKKRAG